MRKRKFRTPGKYPFSFGQTIVISLLIFILLTVQSVWLVNKQITPTLLEIANMETQKIATSTINHAVSTTLEDVDMNELIEIEKGNNGDITSIGFNGNVYNRVTTNAVAESQHYLAKMEQGSVPESASGLIPHHTDSEDSSLYGIPLGRVTDNALLAQLGPLVPIEFTAIGDVDVELNEEIQETGINNTWVRVSMDLEVDVEIVIPFATDTAVVQTTVPVGMLFIPGEVPDFYSESSGEIPTPAVVPETGQTKDQSENQTENDNEDPS
ncbi:sporulation protein YunB [Alteribacillus persepolensis]|uniref:Sporulation protein YunB n=1 Tax=Alteribacillus persepolensis TaxID=568899 RepID=A0A1G8DSP2_9BACI|nr:sporulation protein YunB [Alteribacillus persepolensis]SDH60703.1 sporulation protein YunB [Alteribacillus persepolensis]